MGAKRRKRPVPEPEVEPEERPEDRERGELALAGLLFTGALALYLATLARTIWWGDSGEFAVVGPLLDIAHPTGYPLFTLLAKLASLVPVGEVAARVNALSAVAGALAVALTFRIGCRLGLGLAVSAAGAVLLAVSHELWDQSTVAEVYSLHAALVAATLHAALVHRERPGPRAFTILALLAGLALANHLTALWSLPAVAWLATGGTRRPDRTSLVRGGLAFAAGLSLYLYLPLRSATGPLFDHGQVASPSNLVEHLSGSQFRYLMSAEEQQGLAAELEAFLGAAADQLGWWWLLPVVVGAATLVARRASIAGALLLLAALQVGFAAIFRIPDKEGYFLPAYLVATLFAAAGARDLVASLRLPRGRELAAAALLLVVAVVGAVRNHPRVDKSHDRSLHDYTEALLDALPNDALVLVENQDLLWSASYVDLVAERPRRGRVVSQYWTCLPWYVAHLRRRFPDLAVPPRVDELVAEREAHVEELSGRAVGRLSEETSARIAAELARANLEQRPVFLVFADFEERTSWQGFALVDRGLAFEVFAGDAPEPEPWELDYPDPSRYFAPALTELRARFVAKSFATACNRAGIVLVGLERYAEALAAFERALAYDPDYAQAHLNAGLIHHQFLPNAAGRERHWRRLLELAPDHAQAESIRRLLEQ